MQNCTLHSNVISVIFGLAILRLFVIFGQSFSCSSFLVNPSRSQQPKIKLKTFFVFIKRNNGIHSVPRDKVPKIRIFLLIIIGWGESSKIISK